MKRHRQRERSSSWLTALGMAAVLALAGTACTGREDPADEDPSDKDPTDEKTEDPPDEQPGASAYAKDSLIVRFRAPSTGTRRRGALARVKGTIEDRDSDGVYDRFAHVADGQLAVVQLGKDAGDVDAAIEELRRDPDILYAERNHVVRAIAAPNDPRFPELYGLDNTGQTGGTTDADIDAVEAWERFAGSSDVVIGVVDTGVDYRHEDLTGNMWVNPGEIPGNRLDDDENGVVDDVHGFNAITGTGDPLDDNDHGSHCAGTIGAVGNNGIGVAGVNWEAQIMALKFIGANGTGFTSDAIAALDYAIEQKRAGVNLRVLSNSWGGTGFSQALLDAIRATGDAGMLFVAAAGNDASDNDAVGFYPASYDSPNVVAVAAVDHGDQLADFSNFGASSVDVGAPGVDILSTTIGDTYEHFSGTSMATPHVAGVAALVVSADDTLTVGGLKDILLTSGDPTPALEGRTASGRRVNAASALGRVDPRPRFYMVATPPSRVVLLGEIATYDVGLMSVAGFAGDVALHVTSEPPIDAAVTITPVVTAPGAGVLSVATSPATAPGVYRLAVTAQSGDLVRSRTVSLRVRPPGTVDVGVPSSDTPIAIPDDDAVGIASVVRVSQPISIDEIEVDLQIGHPFIGDLVVTLTSPQGTRATLHRRGGGSADDIRTTISLPTAFTAEQGAGDWVLEVADLASLDVGALESWTLHVIGAPDAPFHRVAVSPARQRVPRGELTSIDVAVESFGDFTGEVALGLTADPPLPAEVLFDPPVVTPPASSRLTIATDCATPTGDFALAVTGTGGSGRTATANVLLIVEPFGSTRRALPSRDTPLAIPDDEAAGIASAITASEDLAITELAVEVHITHPFIGDLVVQLVGPDGSAVTLHDREGDSSNDIRRTYAVTDFIGASVSGTWQLLVSDHAGRDVGALESWTLHATGAPRLLPPAAEFALSSPTSSCADPVRFTDQSRAGGCGGGSPIAAWAWDFGDGAASSEQNPSHRYAAPGDYAVTLTVTDEGGLTDSTARTVTVK